MKIKRRREERWKRGDEEKRDGKSLCERKGKRENEMWKKKKGMKRECKRIRNRRKERKRKNSRK